MANIESLNNFVVQKIIPLLEYKNLTDSQYNLLASYINEYHLTLNEYNKNNDNVYITEKLNILSQPVNYSKKLISQNITNHMAVNIIKNKILEYDKNNSDKYEKLHTQSINTYRKLPFVEEDNNYVRTRKNGFASSILILVGTIFLGIILGAILFKTK